MLLMGVLSQAFADDLDPHYKFSGVKAPDSPYKNTWGAFQTDLFSGSFSYDYKRAVPPGTNGLAPEISISYNSHSAKGEPAPASYRAAFLRAGELGIISKKLSRNLALSAGLRNILAHEYEEVDYKTVHESIPVAIRDFTKLLKELF